MNSLGAVEGSGERERPAVVLVVADSEWSARSYEMLLTAQGHVVVHQGADRQLPSLIAAVKPDVLLIEHRPPGSDAAAVLQWVREDPRLAATLPTVVIGASPMTRAQRLAIYRAGAWSAASQPLDGDALVQQLQTFIGVRRQITRLQDATLTDAVTGLYSVRGLVRRAREIGAAASRRHEALACVALALDLEPTPPADQLAPLASAAAAEHLAREWRAHGRAADALGPIGPLEFGIVASGTTAAGARALVDRLAARVSGEQIAIDDARCGVRVRAEYVGVDDCAISPTDAVALLRQASRALHENA